MTESSIIKKGDNYKFLINGKEYTPMGYITYFEENNDFSEFSKIGIDIFSVNISFSKKAINAGTGFSPFTFGVYDKKNDPDYKSIDEAIKRVLEVNGEAYIFPRIYVTMPDWWLNENKKETTETISSGIREMLFSQKFREDGAILLNDLIRYIENSEYADRIFAYQISGGNTQEWFHFDLKGSFGKNALKYYNEYLINKGLKTAEKLPDLKRAEVKGEITDIGLVNYLNFANEAVADTVEWFCSTAKKAVNFKKVIGTFYGYSLEVSSPLWGTHRLSKLLESSNIDFFSSPNSYNGIRSLGLDWGDMMPLESVKLHNKMAFIECDIRTHHTKFPEDSRKGSDPKGNYRVPVFKGPDSENESISAIKKSFARQLTHKNALWWFDMFGHWYKSAAILNEIKNYYNIYENLPVKEEFPPEVAIFIDETLNTKIGSFSDEYTVNYKIRDLISNCSVPFDIYLKEDFEKISKKEHHYKAFIFAPQSNSDFLKMAEKYCKANSISFIDVKEKDIFLTSKELKEKLKKCGVNIYMESSDVFYIGNGYCAVHASDSGEKIIKLPKKAYIEDLFEEPIFTDLIKFNMEKHETKLFKVSKKGKD